MSTPPARTNRISAFILFVAVAAAPLPFGSTDSAVIALWCIVLGVAVITASPKNLRKPHLALLGLAAFVTLAYAFVLHEQLAERPWFATPHPIWREAGEVLGEAITPSVSITRNQPYFALGASLAAMLALVCSFIVCSDRHRAQLLLRILAWSGVAYALFGIVSYLNDPTKILWREKEAYRDALTSTFINRNTAAVYFGSCVIVWLLLSFDRVRTALNPGPIQWRKVPNRLLSDMPRSAVFALLMAVICLVAMFMTSSRAGIVLSLASVVVAFTAFFYRDLPRRTGVLAALLAGALLVLVLLQFLGGTVSGRFDIQGLAAGGRLETYRSTMRMIADHPWFGTGLGTFAWSFPPYRSADLSTWGVWDRAHNTLLEIASDLGLPLAGLVAVAWIIVLAILLRGVKTRRRDVIIPVAALSLAILALLHSLIDFSLQIPGYAIVVFAMVGAGLSQSFSSRQNDGMDANGAK